MLRPNAPLTTLIVVECPFCGGKSNEDKIEGQYCLGNLESKEVVMTDTPTTVKTTEDGKLLQTVRVKTEKGEQ